MRDGAYIAPLETYERRSRRPASPTPILGRRLRGAIGALLLVLGWALVQAMPVSTGAPSPHSNGSATFRVSVQTMRSPAERSVLSAPTEWRQWWLWMAEEGAGPDDDSAPQAQGADLSSIALLFERQTATVPQRHPYARRLLFLLSVLII